MPGIIHGIAHDSVVVTFGKKQPFFRQKRAKHKRKGGLWGKEEKTWCKCHIFEIFKLSSYHLLNIEMVPIFYILESYILDSRYTLVGFSLVSVHR